MKIPNNSYKFILSAMAISVALCGCKTSGEGVPAASADAAADTVAMGDSAPAENIPSANNIVARDEENTSYDNDSDYGILIATDQPGTYIIDGLKKPVEGENDAYALVCAHLGFPCPCEAIQAAGSSENDSITYYDFDFYCNGYFVQGAEIRLLIDSLTGVTLTAVGYDYEYPDMPEFDLAATLENAGVDTTRYTDTETVYLIDRPLISAVPCVRCQSTDHADDTIFVSIEDQRVFCTQPNIIIN